MQKHMVLLVEHLKRGLVFPATLVGLTLGRGWEDLTHDLFIDVDSRGQIIDLLLQFVFLILGVLFPRVSDSIHALLIDFRAKEECLRLGRRVGYRLVQSTGSLIELWW